MRDFIYLLSGFAQATKLLSDERTQTASIILPLFQTLNNLLNLNEKPTPDTKPKVTTEDGKELKSALKKSLDFYMKKYGFFENDLVKAITFLDARL